MELWQKLAIVAAAGGAVLLLARWAAAAPPAPEYALTISATVGGTTDPAPGSYHYPEGSVVTVTAYPDGGYLFDHWELDGTTQTVNPIDVLMDGDRTLHAVFVAAPPPTLREPEECVDYHLTQVPAGYWRATCAYCGWVSTAWNRALLEGLAIGHVKAAHPDKLIT